MDSFVIDSPLVTVVMPVYNCEKYIEQAINSILKQTYTHFELLIIDDASTDNTVALIKNFIDSRIRFIEKPINAGLTDSLNLGIGLAKGEYIARMDGDDISLPERFAKQITFLESNPAVVVCGAWFSIIGSDTVVQLPETHEAIQLAFLHGNCMAHPSVVLRKEALNDLGQVYDATKEPAEDYDLWVRLASKGRLHNLQEVLLDYRTHGNQVSNKNRSFQKAQVLAIRHRMFDFLTLELSPEEQMVLDKVINDGHGIVFNDISIFRKLQVKLLNSNTKYFFEAKAFGREMLALEKVVSNRYFLKRASYSPVIYFEYLKIKKTLYFRLPFATEFKLAIKSFVFYKRKD